MSDNVVNLRRFRKAKAREEAAQRAEENRARFGQSKASKVARKAEQSRAEKAHEAGRLEPQTGKKPGDAERD